MRIPRTLIWTTLPNKGHNYRHLTPLFGSFSILKGKKIEKVSTFLWKLFTYWVDEIYQVDEQGCLPGTEWCGTVQMCQPDGGVCAPTHGTKIFKLSKI